MSARRSERRPGLSIRNRLALTYTALIVVTGVAMVVAVEITVDVMNGANIDLLYQVALGTVVVIASLGGLASWLLAGRMLRPLQRLNATAREVDENSLHTRLGMTGPRDEIRSLADTFDVMIARLESAFSSRALFAANASHELRTPLATMKTMIQVALREETDSRTRTLLEGLLRSVDRMTATTSALLELAEAGRAHAQDPVDLAAVAETALEAVAADAARRRLTVTRDLRSLTVAGDRALLGDLVGNLVRNAVVHNVDGGSLHVAVRPDGGRPAGALLTVRNSGEVVPADRVPYLTEPFYRLRQRTAGGNGLGLALVQAIADAHRAGLRIRSRPEGGLDVEVAFRPEPGVRAADGTYGGHMDPPLR